MIRRELPMPGLLPGSWPSTQDTLFPSAALLPLSDIRGGQRPLHSAPGQLRPLPAALAVVPIECGKHDTTSTRWTENDPTEVTDDGKVTKDTVPVVRTDT